MRPQTNALIIMGLLVTTAPSALSAAPAKVTTSAIGKQIDDLVARSVEREKAGKPAEAAALMEEAAKLGEQFATTRLYLLYERLMNLYATYDVTAQMRVTEKALVYVDKYFGPEDFRTASVHLLSALDADYKGDEAKMLREAPHWIAEMQRLAKTPDETDESVTWAVVFAKQYMKRGRDAEARELVETSIRKLEASPTERTIYGGIAYENAADLLTGWGDYPRALTYAQTAIQIYEKREGPNSTYLPIALGTAANLMILLGRNPEAEPLLLRGLSLLEKSDPPHLSGMIRTLQDLASFYTRTGRAELAEPLLLRAVNMSDGATIKSTLPQQVRRNLAEIYLADGKVAEARTLIAQAIARSEGEKKPSVLLCNSYLMASRIERGAGNLVLARSFVDKARATLSAVSQPNDAVMGDVDAELAEIALAEGKPAEAATLLARAATLMRARPYPNLLRESAAISASATEIAAGQSPDWARARAAGEGMTLRLVRDAMLPTKDAAVRREIPLYDKLLGIAWESRFQP
jgi:tetratricopeptide (TPR) repeat protein